MTSTIITHFPFPTVREKQKKVLEMIDSAIKSGYRANFSLEAPNRFWQDARSNNTCPLSWGLPYLQPPKTCRPGARRDFPFVFEVKGRSNFPCIVKEDMGLDESLQLRDPVLRMNHTIAHTRLA